MPVQTLPTQGISQQARPCLHKHPIKSVPPQAMCRWSLMGVHLTSDYPCLFYHNPIANITVTSMYMQSGGENAGFRTEVSNNRVSTERATSTLIGRYSATRQAYTDLTAGFLSDSASTGFWLLLYHFLWQVFFSFWKEVKALKIRDASWVWKFSGMLGISKKLASMFNRK